MNIENKKCVMIIDENLPLGLIANTAAVLSMTIGKQHPDLVGSDVFDKTGHVHCGITTIPISILKSSSTNIKVLRKKLYEPDFLELTVVDFSDISQSCHNYDDFTNKLETVLEEDLNYFGIALFGNKKLVNKLTGSMPLLR